MNQNNRSLLTRARVGRLGEDAAAGYLRSLGHVILERNWRHSRQEIDIISADPAGIHFVEVKSRREPVMAEPQVNVGPEKRRNVIRAAQAYAHMAELPAGFGNEIFFDVVSVVFRGSEVTALEYFPQAWIPMYV